MPSWRPCGAWPTTASMLSDIALHRPTLDDVFLTLTGHAAEDRGVEDDVAPEGDGRRRRRGRRSGREHRARSTVWTAVRVRRAVGDAVVVALAQRVKIWRIPTVLVFELVQPVMFVILFVYVFAGQHPNLGGDAYVDFLMPGIIIQNAIFGSTTTAIGIADDLKAGMVDRFRSLPMARSAVLAGRTTADVMKNFILVIIVIAVGYLVGFNFQNGFLGAIALVILTLAVGFAFSWISATIALWLKDVEAVQAATFTWIFPVVFISSALVPVRGMAPAFQWIAEHNPITYWANLARYFALGPKGLIGQTTDSLEALLVKSAIWLVGDPGGLRPAVDPPVRQADLSREQSRPATRLTDGTGVRRRTGRKDARAARFRG